MSSDGAIPIGNEQIMPAMGFKYSTNLRKLMFIGVGSNSNFYIVYTDNVNVQSRSEIIWLTARIDTTFGTPYDLLVPDPVVSTSLCGGTVCAEGQTCENDKCVSATKPAETAGKLFWENNKGMIIGVGISFIVLLIGWFISLLKAARELQSAIPAQ
jgi:hypothetical protein